MSQPTACFALVAALGILPLTARAQAPDARPFLTGACTTSESFIDLDDLVAEPQVKPSVQPSERIPVPPAELRNKDHEMKIVTAFVVDTTGGVRPGTVALMSSTDADLSRWACDVVPRMHFVAARDHGRVVAAQVLMPFTFRPPAVASFASTDTRAYRDVEVEKRVVIIHNVAPEFPETLVKDLQRGEVVVRFVVDTTGRADMDSFQVISSTNPRFVQSVREAVALTRFLPAEIGGRRVRQVVQQPFIFSFRTAHPYMP